MYSDLVTQTYLYPTSRYSLTLLDSVEWKETQNKLTSKDEHITRGYILRLNTTYDELKMVYNTLGKNNFSNYINQLFENNQKLNDLEILIQEFIEAYDGINLDSIKEKIKTKNNFENYVYELIDLYFTLPLETQKKLFENTPINIYNNELFTDFNKSFEQCMEVMEDNEVIHIYYDVQRFFDERIYYYLKSNVDNWTDDEMDEAERYLIDPKGNYYLNLDEYLNDNDLESEDEYEL